MIKALSNMVVFVFAVVGMYIYCCQEFSRCSFPPKGVLSRYGIFLGEVSGFPETHGRGPLSSRFSAIMGGFPFPSLLNLNVTQESGGGLAPIYTSQKGYPNPGSSLNPSPLNMWVGEGQLEDLKTDFDLMISADDS